MSQQSDETKWPSKTYLQKSNYTVFKVQLNMDFTGYIW